MSIRYDKVKLRNEPGKHPGQVITTKTFNEIHFSYVEWKIPGCPIGPSHWYKTSRLEPF